MTTQSASEPTVLLGERGSMLLVTLNRPSASNAMNSALLRGLSGACEQARDPKYRGVVITGAGRNFCAGADTRQTQTGQAATDEVQDLRHKYHPPLLALWSIPKPVIAAVNGAAAGGGLGLALAADLRIGTPQTLLVPAWWNLGLVPDFGASLFLTRQIGYGRTLGFLAATERMSAEQALALGLLDEIVPSERLIDRACERAESLAASPGRAFELTKTLLRQAESGNLFAQLEAEAQAQLAALEARR